MPLRLGAGAVRLWIRAAKLPIQIVAGLLGHEEPQGTTAAPEAPARRERPRPEERAAPARPAPVVREAAPQPEPTREQTEAAVVEEVFGLEPDEPLHVDDEPELVGEFAEAGAEEGVGAQLRVDAPFPGYNRMRVADIQGRIEAASMAEIAVIQLYEGTHRNRRSVLDAVERRSRQLANEAHAPSGSNGR